MNKLFEKPFLSSPAPSLFFGFQWRQKKFWLEIENYCSDSLRGRIQIRFTNYVHECSCSSISPSQIFKNESHQAMVTEKKDSCLPTKTFLKISITTKVIYFHKSTQTAQLSNSCNHHLIWSKQQLGNCLTE